MRKTPKVLLAAMLACGILTGCHGSTGAAEFVIPEELDMSRDYEITFWAKNDTNKTQTMIYEQAIRDFEQLYPNIKVNLRLYTDYGKIYNDVITNIATNTTPNICITYPDHIATYLTGNAVIPLDELFADAKYGLGGSEVKFDSVKESEIVPQFLEECSFQGHYYALPYMRSTEAVYVNKTYVEKLGYTLPETLTWDFMFEVGEAAMAKDENDNFAVNGQKVMIPIIYKSTDNMMIQMIEQKGSGYSDEEGNILMFNDTTKELLKMIGEHGRTKAFSTFKISSYPANFLNAGQCLFAIDSTAGSTWMGTYAPLSDISADRFVEFETEVMTVPQFDPAHPKMISQGPSVCVFNKHDPQEVLASWLFAQYLLSNDVQIAYAETEGYVPVTLKAQNTDEYQEYLSLAGSDNNEHYDVKIKASKLLMDNTRYTFVTPVFNGSTSVRDAAGQMIESVTKSVRRKETIDDAYLDSLFADVTSLYHLDNLGSAAAGKTELGELPAASKALLISLAVIWVLMGAYYGYEQAKLRRNNNS